jgi:hypothetical protein
MDMKLMSATGQIDCRSLMPLLGWRGETIPGIGVIGASAIAATVPDPTGLHDRASSLCANNRAASDRLGCVPVEITSAKEELKPVLRALVRLFKCAATSGYLVETLWISF